MTPLRHIEPYEIQERPVKRQSSSPEFIAKVALESVKDITAAHGPASQCEVHHEHVSP